MSVPPEVLLLLGVAVCGAAAALAGFVWAVLHGQLDTAGADAQVIFDGTEEREGP